MLDFVAGVIIGAYASRKGDWIFVIGFATFYIGLEFANARCASGNCVGSLLDSVSNLIKEGGE